MRVFCFNPDKYRALNWLSTMVWDLKPIRDYLF